MPPHAPPRQMPAKGSVSPEPCRLGGLRCPLRGLVRDSGGAAALEFALVAPLFIALVVATLQIVLVFVGQQGLETAAEAAAQLIQSGQAQQQGWSADQFRQAACGDLPPFLSCDRLSVDVATAASLGDAAATAPSGAFSAAYAPAYAPGGPDDVEVVRLIYLWPTATTPLGLDLSNQPGGNRRLVATEVFRNEAWQAVTS